MTLSLTTRLTNQFYEWEKRGRGWEVFETPLDLEPPFVPFFFHVAHTEYIDDGKRSTVFSAIVDFFRGNTASRIQEEISDEPLEPFPFLNDSPLRVISISLPKGEKVKVPEMEQLLLMLSYSRSPVSFEIIATNTTIRIQLVCREPDVLYIQSQLKAYFPNCIVHDRSETLMDIVPEGVSGYGIDYGYADEFMRPLAMATSFDLDPYTGLFGILEHMSDGEHAAIQIIFKGAVNSWSESIMRSVTDNEGGSFFLDAPEMVPLAKEKISCPLFGVTIRTVGCADSTRRAKVIAESIGNTLVRFTSSYSNKLIPLSNEGLEPETYFEDILLRQSHRLGMLLNSRELATLVHLPSPSVVSHKLERDIRKTKSAPKITEDHEFILGINEHQGNEKIVTLSGAQRLKHTHVIGATGTGKSTFLLNLIVNDLSLGNGIAVLDPHGDLIESIIPWIPKERLEDVIIIDPGDSDFPVGFNILNAHSDIEKEILSSDLVSVFKRLSTSWGDQMNSVFANAILAFLENEKGGTLVDVRRFLIEKNFRDAYLKTVTDPNIIYYWQKEFPLIKSTSIGPILTRLDTFLRPKLIRNMVAQQKSIDFENVLDTKKILLIKLSQGLIGTENSYLLGTFIVSKIHQAAMARQAKSKEERNDFFVYIDEFQNFITPSMSSILSGARKYHLGLVLAHQDMQQLIKQDSELASSVIANAGTRVCFRVGDADAKRFEDGFSFFEAKDLQNLETGEAIVRVDRPEFDFNIAVTPLPELESDIVETITNYVVSKSREKYGTPKKQVEESLRETKGEYINEAFLESSRKELQSLKVVLPLPNHSMELKQSIPITNSQVEQTKAALIEQKVQSEHRYLQSLIKRMAESRGYKATLEELTPDGKGRVDVVLLRDEQRIACEISVTTKEVWETHNIEKCLAAGYETVIVCSTDKRNLERISNLAKEKLDTKSFSKLLTFEPEELFLYLDNQVANTSNKEVRMKGYRVKVEYSAVPPSEARQKKESVIKTISESIRKLKDSKNK